MIVRVLPTVFALAVFVAVIVWVAPMVAQIAEVVR